MRAVDKIIPQLRSSQVTGKYTRVVATQHCNSPVGSSWEFLAQLREPELVGCFWSKMTQNPSRGAFLLKTIDECTFAGRVLRLTPITADPSNLSQKIETYLLVWRRLPEPNPVDLEKICAVLPGELQIPVPSDYSTALGQ